jgi:hypothetical protein
MSNGSRNKLERPGSDYGARGTLEPPGWCKAPAILTRTICPNGRRNETGKWKKNLSLSNFGPRSLPSAPGRRVGGYGPLPGGPWRPASPFSGPRVRVYR